MGTVNARELSRRTADILDEVTATGRPWLVLRRGRPVAALIAIDPDDLEDWILARAPSFVRSMRQADVDLRSGRVREAADVFADLESEGAMPLLDTTPTGRAPTASSRSAAEAAGGRRLATPGTAPRRRRTRSARDSSKPPTPAAS